MSLKRKSCLLLSALLCFLPSMALVQYDAVSETAVQLRDAGMASDLAWEIVEGLTTEVGPRLAGTEADHRAVEWARRKLEALSFDKVWLERIEFPVWVRYHESARITAPFPTESCISPHWVTAAPPMVKSRRTWPVSQAWRPCRMPPWNR